MFCPKCGNHLPDDARFCRKCGYALPQHFADHAEDPGFEDPVRGRETGMDRYPEPAAPRRDPSGMETGKKRRAEKEGKGGAKQDGGSGSGKLTIVLAVLLIAAVAALIGLSALLLLRKGGLPGKGNAEAGQTQEQPSGDVQQGGGTQPSGDGQQGGSTQPTGDAQQGGGTQPSGGAQQGGSIQPADGTQQEGGTQPSDGAQQSGGQDYASLVQQVQARNMQSQTSFSLVTTDVSEYPSVKLYYSLNDAAGEPLVLTSPTAGVMETIANGAEIERTIRAVERLEGNEGLGIDILVDKSDSMYEELGQVQTILQQFIMSLDYASGDAAEIISFDSYIMYMCTFTDKIENLLTGISNMTPYGMTALYDALVTGINNAGSRPGANCVIAFTDGIDNESVHTYDEVIALALQKEIPVYLIGTGGADESTLTYIAAQTGGYYWNINSIYDMNEILQRIYTVQKNMYCIEYESDPGADAWQKRTVSCVLTDGNSGGLSTGVSFEPVRKQEAVKHAARYEIIPGDVSWTEANDACIARGGHLATITSQQEMDQLTAMAGKTGLEYLWIGGYTSVRDNMAFGHWLTGEPFTFTAWYPGEPSRNDRDGTPEFYLMLWNINGSWSWNDQRNDVVFETGLDYFAGNVGYICEYEQ